MSYNICPACGSRLFLVHTDEGAKQVVEVDGNGIVQSAEAVNKDVHLPPAGDWAIRCGACSWRGTLGQLTVSDR